MLKIGASVTVSPNLQRKLGQALDEFTEEIIEDASVIARGFTPRRSGKAQRAWHVEGRGRNAEAINDVPYIERLDKGWSKQAPRGILKPTLRRLTGQTRRITR